jgi:sirohydrochlorin cobaltochelatase
MKSSNEIMKNSCLVLIAHGSRNPNWAKPFEKLTNELKQDVGEDKLFLCFMENSTPSVEEVFRQIVERGICRVRVLPLFMASGNHFREDIPTQIARVTSGVTNLEVELLPPIGEHPDFLELMRKLARQSVL